MSGFEDASDSGAQCRKEYLQLEVHVLSLEQQRSQISRGTSPSSWCSLLVNAVTEHTACLLVYLFISGNSKSSFL